MEQSVQVSSNSNVVLAEIPVFELGALLYGKVSLQNTFV